MSILDHFNHYYLNQEHRTFSKSLMDFYQGIVATRLRSEHPKILDLGAGSKSLFEDLKSFQGDVLAIDFSKEAISKTSSHPLIKYQQMDIASSVIPLNEKYDLIFDSHCLHCIVDKVAREKAFKNIYKLLSSEGIFASEMMVQSSGKDIQIPFKYTPTSIELENEILGHGFKIVFFVIVKDFKFSNENGDCDLVRIVAQK